MLLPCGFSDWPFATGKQFCFFSSQSDYVLKNHLKIFSDDLKLF